MRSPFGGTQSRLCTVLVARHAGNISQRAAKTWSSRSELQTEKSEGKSDDVYRRHPWAASFSMTSIDFIRGQGVKAFVFLSTSLCFFWNTYIDGDVLPFPCVVKIFIQVSPLGKKEWQLNDKMKGAVRVKQKKNVLKLFYFILFFFSSWIGVRHLEDLKRY